MFISSGTTKGRTVPGPRLYVKTEVMHNVTGLPVSSNVYSVPLDGTQITESDRNRWPPPKGGPLLDTGSEFFSQKREVVQPKLSYLFVNKKNNVSQHWSRERGNGMTANLFEVESGAVGGYYGKLKNGVFKFNWPPDMSSSRHDLELLGTQAVAITNPGNQIANVATAMGELLQDVPRIPGIALWEARVKALMTLGAAGGEFLNYVFGISPTIGDIEKFISAVDKIDKRVDQFVKDAGHNVRRKFTFPREQYTESVVLPNNFSPVGMLKDSTTGNVYRWMDGYCYDALPCFETIRTRTVERDIWFSGAFCYHLPDGYDTHSKGDRRKLMAQLLGAKPDINTLWNLAPWSWAIDWFSDAGTFVKNLTSLINYGTVLRYGYIMETTTVTDTFSAGQKVGTLPSIGLYSTPVSPYPAVSPISLRVTTKKRIRANPFGFGVSWDGLSPIQLAIAAALGITRVAR